MADCGTVSGENDRPFSLKPWEFKADCGTAGIVCSKQDPHDYSEWKNFNFRGQSLCK